MTPGGRQRYRRCAFAGNCRRCCLRQQKAAQQGMVGREPSVLFETPGRLPGQMVGKSDYLHAVFVEAPEAKVGDLMRVRITASAPNSLAGQLIA